MTQTAGGFAFNLALNSGGIIHSSWGRNSEGQLAQVWALVQICMPWSLFLDILKATSKGGMLFALPQVIVMLLLSRQMVIPLLGE